MSRVGGGQKIYVIGGVDDVEEEMYVSEANFLVSEANILVREVSKLSTGAKIFRGPLGLEILVLNMGTVQKFPSFTL